MKQLVRFCVVGCANTAISYAVFSLCYRYWSFSFIMTAISGSPNNLVVSGLKQLGITSIDGAVANLAGYLIGMANSFVWNKFWTFEVTANTKRQAARFIITNGLCLAISTASLFLFTDTLKFAYNLVWLITMAFVTILSFWMSKHWVFTCVEARPT